MVSDCLNFGETMQGTGRAVYWQDQLYQAGLLLALKVPVTDYILRADMVCLWNFQDYNI